MSTYISIFLFSIILLNGTQRESMLQGYWACAPPLTKLLLCVTLGRHVSITIPLSAINIIWTPLWLCSISLVVPLLLLT